MIISVVCFLEGETTAVTDWPVCGVGQYLYSSPGNNSVTCLPCKKGTYMEEIKHNFTVCKNCTDIKDGNLPSVCLPGTENQPDADTNERLTMWLSIANLILVVFMEFILLVFCSKRKFQRKFCSVKLRVLLVNLLLFYMLFLFVSVKSSLPTRNIAWCLDITAVIFTVVSIFYLFYFHKNAAKETFKRLICRKKRYASEGTHTGKVDRPDELMLSKINKSESGTQTPMIFSV